MCLKVLLLFIFVIPLVDNTYLRTGTLIASPNLECMNVTFNCTLGEECWLVNIGSVNLTSTKNLNESRGTNVTVCVPFTVRFVECIKWKLAPDEYVIDENKTLIYDKAKQKHFLSDYSIRQDGSAFVCVPDKQKPIVYYIDIIYLVQCVLSAISLVIGIAIESIVPIKNQDRKPLISHMISLLVFYLSRIILYCMKNPDRLFCYFLSYCIRYTIRAAFTWITVINFEIWNQMRPSQFFKHKSKVITWKKFCYQSLFAWITPAGVIVVTYVLQFARPLPTWEEACSLPLSKNSIQITFFYSATTVLLLVNLLLFFSTTFNLHRVGKDVLRVNKNVHKQLCKFYFKLMTLTGVQWLLGIPIWASAHTISHIYSVIVDSITFLQGLFLLLLIYGCRKSLVEEMRLKFKHRVSPESKTSQVSNISSLNSTLPA